MSSKYLLYCHLKVWEHNEVTYGMWVYFHTVHSLQTLILLILVKNPGMYVSLVNTVFTLACTLLPLELCNFTLR